MPQGCTDVILDAYFILRKAGIGRDELRLDGPTLAGIFQCNITAWNDLSIQSLNPHLR